MCSADLRSRASSLQLSGESLWVVHRQNRTYEIAVAKFQYKQRVYARACCRSPELLTGEPVCEHAADALSVGAFLTVVRATPQGTMLDPLLHQGTIFNVDRNDISQREHNAAAPVHHPIPPSKTNFERILDPADRESHSLNVPNAVRRLKSHTLAAGDDKSAMRLTL